MSVKKLINGALLCFCRGDWGVCWLILGFSVRKTFMKIKRE